MEDLKEVVALLLQLFPGFIAAWILYGFSSYPKPSQFERLAQALVFSFLVKILLIPERSLLVWIGTYKSLAPWNDDSQLLAATFTGICIGLTGSYFAYNDKLYAFARRLGLTTRTAYPSEWYGALSREGRYIVLHLKDGRRIYGWPIQWPSDPSTGHFELILSMWLEESPMTNPDVSDRHQGAFENGQKAGSTVVDSILVSAVDVEIVEILKSSEDIENAAEVTESTSSPAAPRGHKPKALGRQ